MLPALADRAAQRAPLFAPAAEAAALLALVASLAVLVLTLGLRARESKTLVPMSLKLLEFFVDNISLTYVDRPVFTGKFSEPIDRFPLVSASRKVQGTTVADMTVMSDTFRARVEGVVYGAQLVSITPVGEDTYETTLSLDRQVVMDLRALYLSQLAQRTR